MSDHDPRGGTSPSAEPIIVERTEVPYVGVRKAITMQQFDQVADRFPELFGYLASHGAAPAGAPFLRYHVIDMEHLLEVEAGVPATAPVEIDAAGAAAGITAGTVPAGRYVTAQHHGHPDGLMAATADLLAWAEAHDLVWDADADQRHWGARLETYLTDPAEESDLDQWDTELAFRLAD